MKKAICPFKPADRRIRRAAWRLRAALASTCLLCCTAKAAADDGDALQQLRQLIGSAACKTDAECRSTPIGEKACGGPEAWVAWSVTQTEPSALAAAADRHAQQRRRQLAKADGEMASNCGWLADPGAHCATPASSAPAGSGSLATGGDAPGRCVLRAARRGGRAD